MVFVSMWNFSLISGSCFLSHPHLISSFRTVSASLCVLYVPNCMRLPLITFAMRNVFQGVGCIQDHSFVVDVMVGLWANSSFRFVPYLMRVSSIVFPARRSCVMFSGIIFSFHLLL